jgi:hypothetical protein
MRWSLQAKPSRKRAADPFHILFASLRLKRAKDPASYNFAITRERIGGLAATTGQPFRYTQRCTEQLSFVPTGGQRWIRTLQIQIPKLAATSAPSWWIISLGQFERKRLADLSVSDASGTRLNLLTRRQHGDAFAGMVTAKYLSPLSHEQQKRLRKRKARKLNRELRKSLFQYFTALDTVSKDSKENWSSQLASKYESLLVALNVAEKNCETLAKEFLEKFEELEKTTQYLCWVYASPSEVINLRASYTATDPKHKLRIGNLGEALRAVGTGLIPFGKKADKARKVRDNWYRQYGITPIGYRSGFPRGDGASSYYLTLGPPANTVCSLLDWESGSSFDKNQEVNSAFPAVHIHNEDPLDRDEIDISTKGSESLNREQTVGELRAYLRCAPYRHKQILGAAALNFAIVWLLARRQLPLGLNGSLQELILAAPSIESLLFSPNGKVTITRMLCAGNERFCGYIWLLALRFSLVSPSTAKRVTTG